MRNLNLWKKDKKLDTSVSKSLNSVQEDTGLDSPLIQQQLMHQFPRLEYNKPNPS